MLLQKGIIMSIYCQIDGSPMKFSHRIGNNPDNIIRRYRCLICDAEQTLFSQINWIENQNTRGGAKEASGKYPRQNARITR